MARRASGITLTYGGCTSGITLFLYSGIDPIIRQLIPPSHFPPATMKPRSISGTLIPTNDRSEGRMDTSR
ncbi:hypothetical protein BO71DRAFT_397261 [Aspergillus ellipticus CBS 707.79]|uniref:Uncharacterized protein n=1 Tax=Aspergillus ellipticus CBS 707.79 TaxID=1448320 RepID=A0A319E695_9EURO|nr:hypothetical protein BO71DRAFT_397261 [Aspergillus ellipticus CBS 707.79]